MKGSISTLSLVNTYFCYRPNICALKHEYLNTFSQLKGLLFLFDLSEASSSPSLMKQPPPVASRGRLRCRSGAAVLCYMNVAVRSCGTLQDIRLKEKCHLDYSTQVCRVLNSTANYTETTPANTTHGLKNTTQRRNHSDQKIRQS